MQKGYQFSLSTNNSKVQLYKTTLGHSVSPNSLKAFISAFLLELNQRRWITILTYSKISVTKEMQIEFCPNKGEACYTCNVFHIGKWVWNEMDKFVPYRLASRRWISAEFHGLISDFYGHKLLSITYKVKLRKIKILRGVTVHVSTGPSRDELWLSRLNICSWCCVRLI